MTNRRMSLAQRTVARDDHLIAISAAARRHGASALHVFGSVARGTADALSDIDAWVTFPDAAIAAVVRHRLRLFGEIGDVLLIHEMAYNRPPGGAYALVLYATPAGPLQVDWYLAPQHSSRVDPSARLVFAEVAVPAGELPTDGTAEHVESRSERISWIVGMLFIAVKLIVRGTGEEFLAFLGEAYRAVRGAYALEGLTVTEPVSLGAVGTMLQQLDRYADEPQRRALHAVDDFRRALANGL